MKQTEYMKGWSHAGWLLVVMTAIMFLFFIFVGECSAQVQNQHLSVIAKKNSGGGGEAEWSEPAGNWTNNFGLEEGDVGDIILENGDGNTAVALESADPIRGTYSATITSSTDLDFYIHASTSEDGYYATATASEMKITIRNNGSATVNILWTLIGDGPQNITDIPITVGSTEDITVNETSAGDAANKVGIRIDSASAIDITIDSWSLTQ